MAKKIRKKKKSAAAGMARAILPYAIASVVILSVSGLAGGLVGYHVGVFPGVASGGAAMFLCGLLWLAGITYGEFPEGTARSPILMLAVIFVNGFTNFEKCMPQMATVAMGIVIIIAGFGGWIAIAQTNPELNRRINPSLEREKGLKLPGAEMIIKQHSFSSSYPSSRAALTPVARSSHVRRNPNQSNVTGSSRSNQMDKWAAAVESIARMAKVFSALIDHAIATVGRPARSIMS